MVQFDTTATGWVQARNCRAISAPAMKDQNMMAAKKSRIRSVMGTHTSSYLHKNIGDAQW